MTSPDRRFPFGHDPAPPRITEPLLSPGKARTTEPMPAPDLPRMTAPVIAGARRNRLPFQPGAPRRSPVLLPAHPRARWLRLGWIAALSAWLGAVAVLLAVTVPWRRTAPLPAPSSFIDASPIAAVTASEATTPIIVVSIPPPAAVPPPARSSPPRAPAPKRHPQRADVVDPWAGR